MIPFALLGAEVVRFWGVLEVRTAACSLGFPLFLLSSCWGTWLVFLGFIPPAMERPLLSRPLRRWQRFWDALEGSGSLKG